MSCSTITRVGAVVTSYSTSSYVATTVTTQPGSTVATSSPVLVTSCIAGDLICATSTSYSTGQTVLPGSTVTVTRTVPTVVAVVSTAAGSVQTVCDETPTSTFSSSASPSSPTTISTTAPPASPSSSDAPVPSSAETVVTTIITSRISNEPSTSFVRSTLTIPAPSSSPSSLSSSDASDIAGASRIASTPSTSSSAAQEFITSYRTILVTSIDSSGHTSVWESAVPTLLNAPSHGSKGGTSVGAIAGGVVGGVAALVLAAVVFWLMRKKGYFRRGDEEFEEDVWAPRPHSQFYAAGAGPGGKGGSGAGSGSGSDEGGASGEEKLDEKEQAIDAATLERHRSWYNSMSRQGHQGSAEGSGGAGGEDPELLSMEEVYGGMVQNAPTSPAAEAAFAGAGLAAGGPPRRSTSNRLSVYSGSSHSHDGHAVVGGAGYSPQSFVAPPLPPVPDHRLSLHQGFFQNFAGPGEHHQHQKHQHHYQQEELGPPYRSASPPAQLAYLHHGPQRPRSASPPPSHHQSAHDYSTHPHPYPHPYPHSHPQRRPSIPALAAIPPHLRSNSSSSSSAGGVPHRPAPQALQGGGHHMRESSSASSVSYYGSTAHGHFHSPSAGVPPTPQRVQTTDSFSSGSSSSVPGTSRPTTSGESSSPSASRQITPPSSAGPTAPSSPLGGGNNKLDLPSLSPPVPALPVMPSIERLRIDATAAGGGAFPKRPGFDRAASSESFIYVPSQWLGARVVNADEGSLAETVDSSIRQGDEGGEDGEEEERLVGEGEGVDSLGLVKGVEREVVVEPTSVRG